MLKNVGKVICYYTHYKPTSSLRNRRTDNYQKKRFRSHLFCINLMRSKTNSTYFGIKTLGQFNNCHSIYAFSKMTFAPIVFFTLKCVRPGRLSNVYSEENRSQSVEKP